MRRDQFFHRLLFVLCFILSSANGEIPGSVRLIRDGSTNTLWPSGIVQVFLSDEVGWGNVCDNGRGFGRDVVDVICHQLGFFGAATNLSTPFSNAGTTREFGMDDSDTVIQEVDCQTSIYLTLFQCSFQAKPMIDANCDDTRDAIVYCNPTRIANKQDGNIRLVDGPLSNVGLLQLYCDDFWGTVCGEQFSATEALLACAQLGYNTFQDFYTISTNTGNTMYKLPLPSVPIWLRMFPADCAIPDPSNPDQCLTQCSQCPASEVTQCDHMQDIILECAQNVSQDNVGTNIQTSDLCLVRNPEIEDSTTVPTPTNTAPPGPSSDNIADLIIGVVATVVGIIGIVLIVVAVVIMCVVRTRIKRQNKDSNRRSDVPQSKENDYIRPPFHELKVISQDEAASVSDILLPSLIDKANLKLIEKVGQGEFGVVYRGLLTVYERNEAEVQSVAVKTLKGKYSQTQTDELIVEAEKMIQFNHLNVLSLTGVCVGLLESPCLVMPYMSNGSLLSYLRKESADLVVSESADVNLLMDTVKHLLSMCLQVANGMAYLAEHKFVHRDLAARNCMISADAIIKVADFGLAEDIYTAEYFKQERSSDDSVKLPLKWMALESIHYGMFSEKTDVWSYGILCWEVFSAGKSPYPGMSPKEVVEMLDSGERLSKPLNPACTDEIYKLMLSCWDKSPDKRPHFSGIVIRAEKILAPLADYVDFTDTFARKLSEKELKVT